MPAGAAPGERRGGRGKGTRNKDRTEREIIARQLVAQAKTADDEERARIAAIAVQAAKRGGVKLAKDVLEDFMNLFAGMAATYQPYPPNAGQPNKNEDYGRFKECGELAVYCAKELAQYQSPKLRAVMIAATPAASNDQVPADVTKLKLRDPVGASRLYRAMIEGKKAG